MEFYNEFLEIVEVFVKGLLWNKLMVKMVVRMVVRIMVVSKVACHHSHNF